MPFLLQISMVWIEAHYIIHNVACHSNMLDYAQCHVCIKDVFFLVGSTLIIHNVMFADDHTSYKHP